MSAASSPGDDAEAGEERVAQRLPGRGRGKVSSVAVSGSASAILRSAMASWTTSQWIASGWRAKE